MAAEEQRRIGFQEDDGKQKATLVEWPFLSLGQAIVLRRYVRTQQPSDRVTNACTGP
jgi:hypothetical protein